MFRLICYKRLFFYFISHCSAAYFLKVYTCRSSAVASRISAAAHTPTQTTTTGHCSSFRWRIWVENAQPTTQKCFIYLQSPRLLLLVIIFIRLERFVSVMTTIFCCYVKRLNLSVAKLRMRCEWSRRPSTRLFQLKEMREWNVKRTLEWRAKLTVWCFEMAITGRRIIWQKKTAAIANRTITRLSACFLTLCVYIVFSFPFYFISDFEKLDGISCLDALSKTRIRKRSQSY
jgi:hypothetical protein